MNYLVAVDYCFLDFPNGAGRVAWDIAQAAKEKGWNVSLLCMNPRPGSLADGISELDGITIVRYRKPVLSRWNPMRMRIGIEAAASAYRRWLADTHWDAVHIHSPLVGMGVMKVAMDSTRYVYTMHSPIVQEQQINWSAQGWIGRVKLLLGLPQLKSLEKNLLLRSAAIHTLSEFTRNRIQHYHGLGDRVTVIPHWYREEFQRKFTKNQARRILGWPDDSTIFFTVRQLGERYGIDIAIRALARLQSKKQWTFYVGGDGPMRQYLEKLASDLCVCERVRFTGRLSNDDLPLAYQAADAFILPTISLECFGLIVLEAFSCGCPVISTDAGAIPEIMLPIAPNFIVPAGDVSALKEKISLFLDDKIMLPMSDEVQEYIECNYGKTNIASKILTLIHASSHRGMNFHTTNHDTRR